MKTSFDLPPSLLREAKAMAARQGRPLRELVAEALEEKLRAAEDTARPLPPVVKLRGRPPLVLADIQAAIESDRD